ncbi:MAG: plastocyanin/azurin family copper-binding protein [Myxococcota bacterium]
MELLVSSANAQPTGVVEGTVSLTRLSVGSQLSGPEDVLVFLEDAPSVKPAAKGPFQIVQAQKAFNPRVLVVPVGATVEFPNADDFSHNVFSPSPTSKFDLGFFPKGSSRSVTFTEPGIVPVYCNVHPNMLAYVVVVKNHFFVRPDASGRFRFEGVPPGVYQAVAWSPFTNLARVEARVSPADVPPLELKLRERMGAGRHLNKTGKPYGLY